MFLTINCFAEKEVAKVMKIVGSAFIVTISVT